MSQVLKLFAEYLTFSHLTHLTVVKVHSVLTLPPVSFRDGNDVFDQTISSPGRPATAYGFRPDEQPYHHFS